MTNSPARKSFWSGILIGMGIMAAVDEILFHQILAWHHFYDQSTPLVGLISDGFLHAAELIAIVTGFFLLHRLRSRNQFRHHWALAGAILGAGIFQVFDGLVNHKLLRLHQIRYGVENILPYDMGWNVFGGFLILVGLILYWRARSLSHTDKD